MSETTPDADTIDDPSIPVLTERIDLPRGAPEGARPAEPPAAPAGASSGAELLAQPDTGPGDEDGTEVQVDGQHVAVEEQAAQPLAAIEEEPAAAAPGVVAEDEAAVESAAPAPAGSAPEATDDLVSEALRVAVLQRVASALPDQVNATVRELLQPSVDRAIAQLSEEAQVALRIVLQDLVERAVREEMARAPRGDAPG